MENKDHDPLPNKLSALIRVALEDLRKAEKTPRVKIDMKVFHAIDHVDDTYYYAWSEIPDDKKVCVVCFAGTVMIGSLGGDMFDPAVQTEKWGKSVQRKLYALDHIRHGDLISAISGIATEPHEYSLLTQHLFKAFPTLDWDASDQECSYHLDVPKYYDSPAAFKLAMEEIADQLEKVGL